MRLFDVWSTFYWLKQTLFFLSKLYYSHRDRKQHTEHLHNYSTIHSFIKKTWIPNIHLGDFTRQLLLLFITWAVRTLFIIIISVVINKLQDTVAKSTSIFGTHVTNTQDWARLKKKSAQSGSVTRKYTVNHSDGDLCLASD